MFGKRDFETLAGINAEVPQSISRCVQDLFVDQLVLNPEAIAVHTLREDLTYRELEILSTDLALNLIEQGVGLGINVPLCMKKSSWAVVVMLAIMKAGAAFVPLDPKHPESRLAGIVKNVGATIIVSSPQNKDMAASLVGAGGVIVVYEGSIQTLDHNHKVTLPDMDPEAIAYILFTSGSTGKPKSVVLTHRAVCGSMMAHGKAMGISCNTRSLQFASYTFDAMVAEIFTVLVHGGCVCVPTESEKMDNIIGAINELDVNWMAVTPTLLRLIEPASVSNVTTVVLIGEAVSGDEIVKDVLYEGNLMMKELTSGL